MLCWGYDEVVLGRKGCGAGASWGEGVRVEGCEGEALRGDGGGEVEGIKRELKGFGG